MAIDWLLMRKSLLTNSRVMHLAQLLGEDADLIIGKLFRLWSYADDNSIDGRIGYTNARAIDTLVGYPGFAKALVAVGWLAIEGGSVTLPNFSEHVDKTAKERGQSAIRMARMRAKRSQESVTCDVTSDATSYGSSASQVTDPVTLEAQPQNSNSNIKSNKKTEEIRPPDSPPSTNTSLFGPDSEPPAQPAKSRSRKRSLDATQILEAALEALKAIWPRGRSVSGCKALWMTLAPDEALCERIRADVVARKQSLNWTKDKGQYAPSLKTYLEGRYWEEQAYGAGADRMARPGRVEAPPDKYDALSQPTTTVDEVSSTEAAERTEPDNITRGGPFSRTDSAIDAEGD